MNSLLTAETEPEPAAARPPATAGTPTEPVIATVHLTVPVYNEEADLDRSIRRLHAFVGAALPVSARITIADNASTDATWSIAKRLAEQLDGVDAVRLDRKGRGRALRRVWSTSASAVLVYMDVDLSTDLAALLPLIAPLLSGHSDLAIGSRLARGARVVRGPKRELISRGYNLLLHAALGTGFSDAQCGFKAIRRDAARALLPLVRDEEWFFDTELLVLAERAGLRIHEVPVDWTDDADSRVDIAATIRADLRGVARLGRGLSAGAIPLDRISSAVGRGSISDSTRRLGLTAQAMRFAGIGAVSTAAYPLLYVVLRGAFAAQPANAIALFVTALANTAANRRFTFGVRGRTRTVRHQLQGLGVFGVALGVTAGSLALLTSTVRSPGRVAELAILVAANLVATATRFLLLRSWVFRVPGQEGTAPGY